MTKVVAITGGIGSGKSTFSKEVIKMGYKLHDSDFEVANIYKKPSQSFIKYLKKIGLGVSISGKKINKKYISKTIFDNKETKLKLEKYIFEIVRRNRKKFIEKNKKNKEKIIFLDIPLLFENNLNKTFDVVVSIVSSKDIRYKRVRKTKKLSKILFNRIVKSQTTDVVRRKYSDIVLSNNNSMREYQKKINKTLKNLML